MEKSINGYPGYTITENGDIFSTKSKQKKKLKQGNFWTGYKKINLVNKDKVRKTLSVHRLVAETFIPNPENKPQVNHIDGNKENNHVSNLEWVTIEENARHALDNELRIPKRGEDHPMSKIDEETALEIINKMSIGYCNGDIAKEYNLHERYVSLIRHKKRWGELWDKLDITLPKSNKQREKGITSMSKIPLEKQIQIIEELETSTNKEVAEKYNLDPSVMSRVRSGKTWFMAHNAKRLSKG